MSLVILGQSGGPTQLSANDDVFGLMTQVPAGAVKHSPAGLTDSDGNSAFGVPFNLLAYFKHTATSVEQITTVNFCAANAPYKFRVLGIKVRCISNRPKVFEGHGRAQVTLEDGDGSSVFTDILPWAEVGNMETGDTKEVSVVHQDTAIIDTDEGLRCRFSSAASAGVSLPTIEFLVEVQCLRVL